MSADLEEDIDDTVNDTPEADAEPDEDTDADESGDADEGSQDDADEGDEESNDEGDEGSEPAPQASAKPQSREARRVAALAKRTKEAEERAIRAETLAEERGRNNNASQPANEAEARRAREDKLALMSPEERRGFEQEEKIQNMQQQIMLTELRTQDALDRTAFNATARSNPVYAKHQAEVERRLSAERQAGRNWGRETILAQILGEAALKAKPDKKEQTKARERVDSVKGKSTPGRGNSTAYRPGKGKETLDQLEARLENVHF